MPTPKVKVNGKWYEVGGLSEGSKQEILDSASEYADSLNQQVNKDISGLQQTITNTNTYIDGAFKDGIITQAEAKAIQSYVNTLTSKKAQVDTDYSSLRSNPYIDDNSKDLLDSAKQQYDNEFQQLINDINSSIADGIATSAETSTVDLDFTNYDNAVQLFASAMHTVTQQIGDARSKEDVDNAKGYTDGQIYPLTTEILNAQTDITQNANEIQLRATKEELTTQYGLATSDAVSQAKVYSDQLKTDTDASIDKLQGDIDGTNTYVDGAFKDGLVTSLEASTIQKYLNTLANDKGGFDSRFNALDANPYLETVSVKSALESAKTNLDSAYDTLIATINSIVTKGTATTDDRATVDAQFQTYNNNVALLLTQVESATDDIAHNKALEAQNNAQGYTDGELVPIRQTITDTNSTITQMSDQIALKVSSDTYDAGLQDNLDQAKQYTDAQKIITEADVANVQSNVDDTKTYVDGTFKDGIVYDSEKEKIKAYLNTLGTSKNNLDNRYTEIDTNPLLTGSNKTDLETAYTNYNTCYNNLVDAINNVVNDVSGVVTQDMQSAVDSGFNSYNGSVALLASELEKSTDFIGKTKSDTAEANAKAYADTLKSDTDNSISQLSGDLGTTNTYIDGAFHDGVIQEAEAKKIDAMLKAITQDHDAVEAKYTAIYENPDLLGTPKVDLYNSKGSYDTSYNTLITDINTAIADGKTTQSETDLVDNDFTNYTTCVADLRTKLEAAIDSIAKKKADDAEYGANQYTDGSISPIDSRLSKAESSITQNQSDIQLRVTQTTYDYDMNNLQNQMTLKVEIISTNGNTFKNGDIDTALQAYVYKGTTDITSTIDASRFVWLRSSADTDGDSSWNADPSHTGVKAIAVTTADVSVKATFTCEILDTTS